MNVKLLILYGVLAGILIIALLYFLNVGAVKPSIDKAFASLMNLGNFNSGNILSSVGSLVTQNWTTIAAVGIPAVTAVITYVKYKSELTAKKELLKIQQDLEIQNSNASSINESANVKIKQLEDQVKTLSGDNTAEELQKTLSTIQDKNKFLTTQTQDIIDRHDAFIQKLAAAANNQIITDPLTQKQIQVLKVTNEIVTVR